MMFFFNSDDYCNCVLFKVGDLEWSKLQSFDVIGSMLEVVFNFLIWNVEIYFGVIVELGQGKYKMIKMVILVLRYVI